MTIRNVFRLKKFQRRVDGVDPQTVLVRLSSADVAGCAQPAGPALVANGVRAVSRIARGHRIGGADPPSPPTVG